MLDQLYHAANETVSSLRGGSELWVGDQQERRCSAIRRSRIKGQEVSRVPSAGGCFSMGHEDQFKGQFAIKLTLRCHKSVPLLVLVRLVS